MKYLLLGLTILLGIYLRLSNLSPFKIYPDSYLQLILAENIQHGGKVIGTLGKEGMMYPDFLAWTRPMFPLILSGLSLIFPDVTQLAVAISLLTSILAIPVIYFLLRKLFGSDFIPLLGALLLAVSFNHIVWSGFILTEPLGVLVMSLFLYAVFSFKKDRQSLLLEVITGILFASCVLTRYEYSLLIFPTILYLRSKKISWSRIISTLSFSLVLLLVAFTWLFPKDVLMVLLDQFLPHVRSLSVLLIILGLSLLIWPKIKTKSVSGRLSSVAFIIWLVFSLLLLIHSFLYPIPHIVLDGVADFIRSDLLLSLCFMSGVGLMIRKRVYNHELIFVLISSTLLYAAYYRANPYSQRYLVHLLPLTLIPASYFLKQLFIRSKSMVRIDTLRIIIGLFLFLILLYQVFLSFLGMKNWQQGLYRRISYEEKSGVTVSKILSKDAILLVSFPESYYVTTHHSVYSLADSPPFIYIPDTLSNRKLIIIEDMGMRDLYPNFSRLLESSLKDKKKQSFPTHSMYQYADRVLPENYPVTIYETTPHDLKVAITKQFHLTQTF